MARAFGRETRGERAKSSTGRPGLTVEIKKLCQPKNIANIPVSGAFRNVVNFR